MRLDKYLKVTRIIKRRTVANEASDAAHVTANGRPAKASYDVKVGDILEITFGVRTLRIRVLDIKDTVGKDAAASLYEVIES
jgi:ribosomal 50S subunit-recycling heat shock protein